MKLPFLGISILLILVLGSCRKDRLTTKGADKLSFSTDTLAFDTVFTSLGSDTRYFKIYNPHSQSIRISSLKLGGGSSSFFRLNVDGVPTKGELNNLVIAPHDSMYVFAALTINPDNADNPFVVEDSVVFVTNGNSQKVLLLAYGQNAHFYYSQTIGSQTWNPDKPYVVINTLEVPAGSTLTIQPGCRIFMHAGAILQVDGTLRIMGMPHDSIVFRGDRLEYYYVDLPGNWGTIWLRSGSQQNEIHNAIIKEATVGVRVDGPPVDASPWKLQMSQTVINYCLSDGILGVTASLRAENCLVINCGENVVRMELGGVDSFIHCTLADFSNVVINHQKPVLRASNYYEAGSAYFLDTLHLDFVNCILYGGLEEELSLDSSTLAQAVFHCNFDHCFLRSKHQIVPPAYLVCNNNIDPLFQDVSKDNYHLSTGSPCHGAGDPAFSLPFDLDNNPRSGLPDAGCYRAP